MFASATQVPSAATVWGPAWIWENCNISSAFMYIICLANESKTDTHATARSQRRTPKLRCVCNSNLMFLSLGGTISELLKLRSAACLQADNQGPRWH